MGRKVSANVPTTAAAEYFNKKFGGLDLIEDDNNREDPNRQIEVFASDESADESQDGGEEVEAMSWGRKAQNFYGGGEEGLSEEEGDEVEAQRIQKLRAGLLNMDLVYMGSSDEDEKIQKLIKINKNEISDDMDELETEMSTSKVNSEHLKSLLLNEEDPSQKRKILKKLKPKLLKNIRQMGQNLTELSQKIIPLLRVASNEDDLLTEAGSAYLDVKTQLLVSHLKYLAAEIFLDATEDSNEQLDDRLAMCHEIAEKLLPVEERYCPEFNFILGRQTVDEAIEDMSEEKVTSAKPKKIQKPKSGVLLEMKNSQAVKVLRKRIEKSSKSKHSRQLRQLGISGRPKNLTNVPTALSVPTVPKKRSISSSDLGMQLTKLRQQHAALSTDRARRETDVNPRHKIVKRRNVPTPAKDFAEMSQFQESETAHRRQLDKERLTRRQENVKSHLPAAESTTEGRRSINRRIATNVGLTRQRKKSMSNARVHLKEKYTKKIKQLSGVRFAAREGSASGGYDGEARGISTKGVVRSRRLH